MQDAGFDPYQVKFFLRAFGGRFKCKDQTRFDIGIRHRHLTSNCSVWLQVVKERPKLTEAKRKNSAVQMSPNSNVQKSSALQLNKNDSLSISNIFKSSKKIEQRSLAIIKIE